MPGLAACIEAPAPLPQFAGWWGLVVAGIAWYIAAADVINEQFKRVGWGRLWWDSCVTHTAAPARPRPTYLLLLFAR
jgi:hypothetical protein